MPFDILSSFCINLTSHIKEQNLVAHVRGDNSISDPVFCGILLVASIHKGKVALMSKISGGQ